MKVFRIFAIVGLLAATPWAADARGRQPALAMEQIDQGGWELRFREGGMQRICLADAMRLLQLKHPDIPCDRVVVEDTPSAVTVQYTCRGRGYGRTRVRRESAQLVQVEAQGISDGLPFEFSAEGRRVGTCSS